VSGFELSSRALPGATILQCQGRKQRPSPPNDLPDAALLELDAIQSNNQIKVSVISGVIEPDSDWRVITQRVARHYRPLIVATMHPERTELADALSKLSAAAQRGQASEVRATTVLLLRLAEPKDSTTDSWSVRVPAALRRCAEYLLEEIPTQGLLVFGLDQPTWRAHGDVGSN